MNRCTQRRRFAAFVLTILAAVVLFSAAPAARAQQNPIAFTFNGPVRGVVSSAGIHEFLGIPYAAAPVGNLRWRPPVPHASWFSILDATQFANHCPQPATPFGRPSLTEDCLFLNVFTPGTGNFFLLRPVMVWVHGGALVDGESDDYDPTAMVRDGVIVVTINYRLGALGFLAHPAFAAEETDPDHDGIPATGFAGNYGLMDHSKLRQIHDQIAPRNLLPRPGSCHSLSTW